MPKQVTRERILAAHEKKDKYSSYLLDKDTHIIQTAAHHGLMVLLEQDPKGLERTKGKLEMIANDVLSPEDGEAVMARWLRNINRVHKRKDRIHAIQLAHNISGLEMGQRKIGEGIIDCWEEVWELWLTDDDLNKLRDDRAKLLQFWVDHVELNQLKVFWFDDEEWVESSIDAATLAAREYDWADPWERIRYFDESQWTRASVGDVLETSKTPVEGYSKDHEIHLRLGTGKLPDHPERSLWFCATNRDCPSY